MVKIPFPIIYDCYHTVLCCTWVYWLYDKVLKYFGCKLKTHTTRVFWNRGVQRWDLWIIKSQREFMSWWRAIEVYDVWQNYEIMKEGTLPLLGVWEDLNARTVASNHNWLEVGTAQVTFLEPYFVYTDFQEDPLCVYVHDCMFFFVLIRVSYNMECF